jgi:O-antigen/teichoic acid export membrane protein
MDHHGRGQVARNAVTSYAVRGLLGLSALLLTPYLFRRLGVDGFGTWSVMFTLATVGGMLELAFTAGVARVVAHYRGAEGAEAGQDALSGSIALAMVVGVLVGAVLAAAGVLASELAAPGLEDDFRVGMLAIACAAVIRWPCLPAAGALIGCGRYDLVNVSRSIEILGAALLAVVAVELSWGVFGIAGGYAVATVLAGLLLPVLLRREDRSLVPFPRVPDAHVRAAILGTTPWVTLGESVRFASQQFDTVLISAIRGAVAAAPFAAAIKLQSALQSLAMPFLHLVMPIVSDLHARGADEAVRRRLIVSSRLALQLTLPAALGLALFAPDIVRAWLGAGAPNVTETIVVLLAIAQIFIVTTMAADQVLIGVGRARMAGTLTLVEGAANLTVSLVLISAIGALGAAIGTLAVSVLVAPIRFPLACQATETPIGRFVREALAPPCLRALPAVVAMTVVWAGIPEGNLRLAIGILAGVVFTLLFAARPSEIRSVARRRVDRVESPQVRSADV